MWIKRNDTRIHYKTPAKTYYEGARETGICVRFLFSKLRLLVRDEKHVIVQVYAQFGKTSGLVRSHQNTNHGSTKLALIFP